MSVLERTREIGVLPASALPGAAVQSGALTVMSGTSPPPALDDLVARIAPHPPFLDRALLEESG